MKKLRENTMAVVPVTQFSLGRERRQMAAALQRQDWTEIQRLDQNVKAAVDRASDDPERDMASLLAELKQVVSLYRELIDSCDENINLGNKNGPG